MNVNSPIAPLPLNPVQDTQRTDYLPTHREEEEGRRQHREGRNPQQGSSQHPARRQGTGDAVPDGTFLDTLTSLDPIFNQYRHRIPHIAPLLTEDQRHLLGALYATASHRGYALDRIDAIAKRLASPDGDYAHRVTPNPMAASGLVIDTQA